MSNLRTFITRFASEGRTAYLNRREKEIGVLRDRGAHRIETELPGEMWEDPAGDRHYFSMASLNRT